MMGIGLKSRYRFRNHDRNGRLLWERVTQNLVTVEGQNDVLTEYFKGSGYTAEWFVGVIDSAGYGSVQPTDTAAKITTAVPSGGTNQWKEVTTSYSESVRQTLNLGTVSGGSVSNAASLATFTVTSGFTLRGGFLVSDSAKGGTSGKLYGEAAISSVVVSPGSLTVEITLTATSV